MMIFFRAELEREAGGSIFNAAEGTETRNQVCKQLFSRSMVINLLGRWKILATMDLPSHPARLAHVGLLATRQVLLNNRAQALEQRARLQLWTRTTWWRRMVESGFGPRPARNGSGRLRQEPTRFVLCIILVHISAIVSRRNLFNWFNIFVFQANAAVEDSGSSDSGWTMLPNGTWARKTSSWSSHTQTSSRSGQLGGVGAGVVLPGGGGEYGHQGSNDTGWITQPDGTMVKKSSSWASWSSSSHEGLSDSVLEDVQRGLEQRVRNQLPGNVEPGYEQQWRSRARSRRSIAEFESELASCGSRCTVIKCTIGPLEKDESVLFKIRSRLFTETQVKNYAEKVKISSKLVTRVTRLPFLVPEEHLAFQSHSVTTTVIPSEPGEVS